MFTRAILVTVAVALSAGAASGQAAGQSYLTPPQVIVDILDAPPLPTAVVSPARDAVMLLERKSMPSIAELAQPMLRLAGLRLNPATSGPHRLPDVVGLTLKQIDAGTERPIATPSGAAIGWIGFAADGTHFAFAAMTNDRPAELWIGSSADATAAPVAGLRLNASLANPPCRWFDDGRRLACTAVPSGRGAPPPPPTAPAGPNIQEHSGGVAPVRTYQDLLASPHDDALFEHFATAEVVIVDAAARTARSVGAAGLVSSVDPSPDGRYLLVERVERPFSRLVPAGLFPTRVEVWDEQGAAVRTVATIPLSDAVPIGGVMTGPRNVGWQATAAATLVWAEALDGGDPKATVPHRDRVVSLTAPFAGEPAEVVKTEYRFMNVSWTERGLALVTEFDRPKRWTRTWILGEGAAPRLLFDRSSEDAYGHPGTPVSRPGSGRVLQVGSAIYLTGTGATPQGDRPFLDRLDLDTRQTTRLFLCDESSYETVVVPLDDQATRVLTRRETPTEPPNYQVRDLRAGTRRALTAFADPAPQLTGIERRRLTYERADGVKLSARLYLPPGYQPGQRLPTIAWAYPREFADPSAAGQVTGSLNRFTTITGASHLLLLTQGYAILDDPAMPIVGPGETANDTYVDQLVANAEAAVKAVVEAGVADPDRLGIGGHSYGAFMTANLLAHSDLFRAGIARSGAYNRTLTPFGFQNERRTFWEVPEIYANMSPFWFAHKVNEPVLLLHGEADNNSGTFPIQSERFYMALKGHGATVRYVTLPHESHGYAARESVLHTLYEMLAWADAHVKNAPPRERRGTNEPQP